MKRKVIALTGGIGSGKSTVARILREMGYKTVDCDVLAKEIADEAAVVSAVERLLGSDSVTNGAINRHKVREMVFGDGKLLREYNAIFHGRIRQRLVELVEQISGTIFVEIAVIDAFEFHFDEIWLVDCPQKTRIERVTSRDNVTADNATNIMARQRYDGDYTRVLTNDGTLDELKAQVTDALIASGLAD